MYYDKTQVFILCSIEIVYLSQKYKKKKPVPWKLSWCDFKLKQYWAQSSFVDECLTFPKDRWIAFP